MPFGDDPTAEDTPGPIAEDAYDPAAMLSVVDNEALDPVADEVGERLTDASRACSGPREERQRGREGTPDPGPSRNSQ